MNPIGRRTGVTNFGNAATGGGPIGVGVLTVIQQEMRAVRAELERMRGYRERSLPHGPRAHEAWLPDRDGRPIRVAAVQTLRPGTNAAALAYRGLVEEYRPAVVLLVGVAGGVRPDVTIGDVVVSDQVISYDFRRETADGPARRGESQTVEAAVGHRLNDFFVAAPDPVSRAGGGPFRLFRGPIGSGNAVVTDAGSAIRSWLHGVHEKVLAVETEAAGVAQSFAEGPRGTLGWLTVRGISDTADAGKGHGHHDLAAANAARVMTMLLPYLSF